MWWRLLTDFLRFVCNWKSPPPLISRAGISYLWRAALALQNGKYLHALYVFMYKIWLRRGTVLFIYFLSVIFAYAHPICPPQCFGGGSLNLIQIYNTIYEYIFITKLCTTYHSLKTILSRSNYSTSVIKNNRNVNQNIRFQRKIFHFWLNFACSECGIYACMNCSELPIYKPVVI